MSLNQSIKVSGTGNVVRQWGGGLFNMSTVVANGRVWINGKLIGKYPEDAKIKVSNDGQKVSIEAKTKK